MVTLLLDHAPETITKLTKNGKTPEELAEDKGHPGMVEYLRKRGEVNFKNIFLTERSSMENFHL